MAYIMRRECFIKITNEEDINAICEGLREYVCNDSDIVVSSDKTSVYAENITGDDILCFLDNLSEYTSNSFALCTGSGWETISDFIHYDMYIKYPDSDSYSKLADVQKKDLPANISGILKNSSEVLNLIKKNKGKILANDKKQILKIFGESEEIQSSANSNELIIDEKCKSISESQYAGEDIEKVVFSSSVTKIGRRAFQSCHKLKEVVIPGNIKEIAAEAFEDCIKLEKVTIESGCIKLADGVFSNCPKLKKVILPENMERMGKKLFMGCTSITDIVIPEGIKKIDNSMFEGCAKLNNIVFKDTITQIGNRAFYGCKGLVDFEIPKSVPVESIGKSAFTYVKVKKNTEGVLSGKTFVATGNLKKFPEKSPHPQRKELQIFIEARGGKLTKSVSGKTSYLISNDKNSKTGKMKDAIDKGVPIITEAEFLEMAGE